MKKFIVNSLAVVGGLTVAGMIATAVVGKKMVKQAKEIMTDEGFKDLKDAMNKAVEQEKMKKVIEEYANKNDIKLAWSADGSITYIKDGEIRDEYDSIEQAYNYVTEQDNK